MNIQQSIDGFDLVRTCGACPEQYDVYKDGKQVGYLRLRHGVFRADYPQCGGRTVYTAEPKGDGIFEPEERDFYLSNAIHAIKGAQSESNLESTDEGERK